MKAQRLPLALEPLATLALVVTLATLALSAQLPIAHAAGKGGGPVKAPCAATPPASASEGEPLSLATSIAKTGCIDVVVRGATAPSVSVVELDPSGAPGPPLTTAPVHAGSTAVDPEPTWQCDRPTRTFRVSEVLGDGTEQSATTVVTTPSCATRLSADVLPERAHRDHPVAIAVSDHWHLGGLRAQLCLGSGRARPCTTATLKAGSAATIVRLRPRSAGLQTLELANPYERLRLRLQVLSSRPVLLATGDSEMQVLDDDLSSDLSGAGGARVIGDARQSTAISSPFFFDWPAHTFGQVAEDHPDVVAMFLGGNEGFRLGSAECCGAGWSQAYAQRVAGMMRTYRQRGVASVYWFLIPTPSHEPFVKVVRAVNRGIVEAAEEFPEGVHVFDLRPVFSPGGRYIDSLSHDGRTITVHESDGFHLSESADVIVARMFIARMRSDGVL